MVEILFWILVGIVLYVYFGYPLLLIIIARFGAKPVKKGNITPSVSMIIAAYNEEKCIREKLENSLSLDYPKDKLEIIVVSNGSTDRTDEIVSAYSELGVRLNSIREPGKTSAQNVTVSLASGEVILFSDANSIYHKHAVRNLVRNFADEGVGLVQGRAVIQRVGESLVTKGVGLYSKYEDRLKTLESRLGRSITGYGGMIAIRKELYEPINVNFMEDFMLPIVTLAKGRKVLFEPEALYYEKAARTLTEEFSTRARIVTQDSLAFFAVISKLLSSLKGSLIFQLVSHKFLRWTIPFFLILLLFANLLLVNEVLYLWTLLGQVIFYMFTLIGYFCYKKGIKPGLFYIPFYFCLVNGASLVGLINMALGKKQSVWSKAESTR